MSEAESESDFIPPPPSTPLPLTASEEQQVDQFTRIGLVATHKYPSDILTEDDRREMEAIRRSMGMLPRESQTVAVTEEQISASVSQESGTPHSERRTSSQTNSEKNFSSGGKFHFGETSEMPPPLERESPQRCYGKKNGEATKKRRNVDERHVMGRSGKKMNYCTEGNCSKICSCRCRFGYQQARCSSLHSKCISTWYKRPAITQQMGWATDRRLLVCSLCNQQLLPREEHWLTERGWYGQQLSLSPLFSGSHLLNAQRDSFRVRPAHHVIVSANTLTYTPAYSMVGIC